MGMTWDEYYKNRQKKKKEEQQKAETKNKQNISSNKSIKIQQTVSPSTSLGSTFQRTIQPSDSANNTINTNAIKKNSPSLWNQIQSIVKPNDTVSKFKQLSPEDKESFERTSYTLSDAEYKAKKEADEFNRIMEKGTKKEQIEAVIDRIGKSILGGFKKPIGGLINIGTTAGADILKTAKLAANDESKEQFDKWQRDVVDYGRDINDQATEFDQSNAKINNPVVKYGTGALNTVSNVIANYVLTGGKGGTILQGLQVGGSSAQEVLNKDYNATGQAIATGAAKGYLSKKTEEMFDANILTRGLEKSSIQDVVNQTIKNKIKSGLGQKVASKTAGIVGENIEEFVEDNVGNVIDKIVNNEDMPSLKEWWNNTTETAKATTLSTVLMNMMGIGGGDINEIETDLKNQNLSKEDIEKTKKAIQVIEQENLQNQDNKVINQETKIAQNGLSQEQNDAKTQTTNNLAKVRQFYDEDTYNQMKNFIETAPSEEALNQINEDIKTETKNRLEETYKSERFTESQDRKRTYAQYQRQNNTTGIQYDNSVVDNALDTVPANRNDKRTVGQWKQVAEQIGLNASDLTKSQIDDIAYGSWFDLQPTKNITRYDNRTKENKSFEKFTSDDWINTIYESAKEQKLQKLDTELNQEQYSLAETQPQNNFKYEQSDNAKIDTFRQDASRYWDNSEKTTKLVNTIEKIIDDKGYNIRLDDTLGDNVNGRIVTNKDTGETEITINPNSSRKGEFIIGHELTHAIETDEMTKLVKQRMEKDGELRNAVEDLKKLYGTDDINAEVLADISGQLFGNQEFINNLSVEKPSVFKRIYDKIISLANKITGNSNEALFIKDLKSKWEKAYRENTNTINEEQYSKSNNITTKNHKQQQNKIIQENNPMDKTLGEHTWINSADDIKTYQEAIEEFGGIDNITPDFTAEDVKKALDTGKMIVYSSYPIEQGTFVTPSKMEAQSYAGKSQVYSKEINLSDVAWIDEVQGQYAKVNNSQDTLENKINTLTNDGITMTYVRNPNTNTKNYGTTYGQNLEPAGEYMSMDTLKGEYKVPGFEYGTITFKNPLVIEHKDTTEKGWKKDLSDKYNGLTGRELSNAIKKDGYDAIMTQDKDGNFIEIINLNGIKDDTKYSKQNNNWQDYLENNYKSEGTTTDLRDIRLKQQVKLPMKEKQEVKAPLKQQENNTPGENINWTEIERPENNQKFRKHYKSIIESSQTTAEAKSIAKDLMGTDTYVPETNKGQLAQADQRIMTSSPEVELQALRSRVLNGERITSVDIAVGERLIQYFSKTGSAEQLQDAIQTTALAGTSTGQTLQALTILNHQTPQGQVTWLQRSIDKMNKELAKKKGGTITTDADGNIQIVNKQGKDITNKVDLFNLTPEMMNKIMQSENQEQMLQNIDEVYEELGQQVPKGMLEKIDSWRYFSMLANIRTHGRNMIGNFAMGKMQRVKDKIAGGIEDVVSKFNPEMERTKTLRRADKKTKEFAKNDFKNVEVQSRLELNESKFNPQSRLQNARRTFKSDAMENTLGRLFNLNDKLLEAEDGIGLKSGYQKALADYITANKIDVDNITDAQLNKARNYAIQQAKEATFHQANAIASAVTQFQNKNKVTKFFVDAILPFKKTPMNVVKAGMEYSPLQIAQSATIDLVNLRKGNISINQYIDNLSKGMTGTGILLAGFALAKAGILKASGSDDKDKEKYDEEQGKQSYSIEIAGKTYSLDWLAPAGIPLFMGAEAYKLFNQGETEKSSEKSSEEDGLRQTLKNVTNMFDAGATAIDPMNQMSMISGLTNMLSSYNSQDKLGSLGAMMTNAGKSYVNQFFPTLMGQVAKTGDEYERTTKSTATGTIGKAVDQTINQVKAKIPGLRQTLPIKTDIWGKDVKQEVNLPLRAFNNFINPATVKDVSTDKVDAELNKLYDVNKNKDLLPDILTKTIQLNNQTYRLSNKEYAEATKNYGQNSYKLIGDFIKTSDYNNLTQEQKETAISNIYSYVKEQNKIDYAKKVNEDVKSSTLYDTMEEIKEKGGNQSEYLNYLSKTKGLEKESEKNKVLADSKYSNKTKEIIYTNGAGKDDKLYNNLLSKSDINMTEYLKYKNKVSEKAFKADKDKKGKTITGSAKNKLVKYLNSNVTGAGNRLLIAGNSYALSNSERQSLSTYINKIASTKDEKIEIYKQLDKNFVVNKGKVYMKVSKK